MRMIPPPSRAEWMIDQLVRFIGEAGGDVLLARDPDELEYNLSRGVLSTMLVIEGGQILNGRVEELDHFFQRGVRGIGRNSGYIQHANWRRIVLH